jgi:hypothetical protein
METDPEKIFAPVKASYDFIIANLKGNLRPTSERLIRSESLVAPLKRCTSVSI